MEQSPRRLSGRQITTIFVVGCLTLVLLPWGAWAAKKQLVTITGKGGHKVAVTKGGALKVTPPKGPLSVTGDVGVSGNVGIDGTVPVTGAVGVDGPVTTKPQGTPFQVIGSGSARKVLGHGTVALTDLVMSQDNGTNERLNVTMNVYAGNGDCSTLTGASLGQLLPYSYLQAEEIVSVSLSTPLVVEAPTVCLAPSVGTPASLFFNYTVGGYAL